MKKKRPLPVPASRAIRPGSSEPYFNSAGRMNASNVQDLIATTAHLMNEVAAGLVTYDETASDMSREEYDQFVYAAVNGTDAAAFTEVASVSAQTINTQLDREGLLRQFLMPVETDGRTEPEIPLKMKGVVGVVGTGIAQVQYAEVRDKYFKPPALEFTAAIEWKRSEARKAGGGWLDRKTTDAFEALMVKEDRLFMKALDATEGIVHSGYSFATLSPQVLAVAINDMETAGLPRGSLLMSSDLWTPFSTEASFQGVFSEVDKLEIFRTGKVASVYGVTIYTEATRRVLPETRVMRPGSFYVLSTPEFLGGYFDMGVEQNEKRVGDNATTSQGIFLVSEMGFIVGNAAAVIKGQAR